MGCTAFEWLVLPDDAFPLQPSASETLAGFPLHGADASVVSDGALRTYPDG
jgi:hypothetical protein